MKLKIGDLVKPEPAIQYDDCAEPLGLAIVISKPRKDPWILERHVCEIRWVNRPEETWTIFVDEVALVGDRDE